MVKDLLEEVAQKKNEELCENEPESFKCELCQDTGIIEKTEWCDTDTSYEVEHKCECQLD